MAGVAVEGARMTMASRHAPVARYRCGHDRANEAERHPGRSGEREERETRGPP